MSPARPRRSAALRGGWRAARAGDSGARGRVAAAAFTLFFAAGKPIEARADEPQAPAPAPGTVPSQFAAPVDAPAPATVTAPPPPATLVPIPEAPPVAPSNTEVERRLRALEEQNLRLADELKRLREDHDSVESRLNQFIASVSGRLTGYLDFGLFYVSENNGAGIVPDTGHALYPQYKDIPDSWVFIGDPLSTAVNSRGEPADTGPSRAVTFDSIHNGGALSFIVNSLTINLFAALGSNLTFNSTFDLVPRSRNISKSDDPHTALGDFLDLRLVYIEYRVPIDAFDLRLTVGKFDSVLGIEYRAQESPDRITVTPSLICRYTCGHPLGLKARARFGHDLFVINLAITNGSHQVEYFPFYDEIDTNLFKTVAGRVSTKLPVGSGLEIGFSAAIGAQDFQTQNNVYQWHYGFDLHLAIRDFDLRAEAVQGQAQGQDSMPDPTLDPALRPCDLAPCLSYRGAYVQIAYRVTNWLTPYARIDARDALHRDGESFIYISQLMRATGGARVEIGSNLIVKAEYTRIQELGLLPLVPVNNNVFTSSLVVKW